MTIELTDDRPVPSGPTDPSEGECPVTFLVGVFRTKWTAPVLHLLAAGPRRHGELLAALPAASQKMLTSTLRTLEHDGLVHREVVCDMPPHVEYSLTVLGESLMPIFREMKRWSERNAWRIALSRRTAAAG